MNTEESTDEPPDNQTGMAASRADADISVRITASFTIKVVAVLSLPVVALTVTTLLK